jgi:hypothetical protein
MSEYKGPVGEDPQQQRDYQQLQLVSMNSDLLFGNVHNGEETDIATDLLTDFNVTGNRIGRLQHGISQGVQLGGHVSFFLLLFGHLKLLYVKF